MEVKYIFYSRYRGRDSSRIPYSSSRNYRRPPWSRHLHQRRRHRLQEKRFSYVIVAKRLKEKKREKIHFLFLSRRNHGSKDNFGNKMYKKEKNIFRNSGEFIDFIEGKGGNRNYLCSFSGLLCWTFKMDVVQLVVNFTTDLQSSVNFEIT